MISFDDCFKFTLLFTLVLRKRSASFIEEMLILQIGRELGEAELLVRVNGFRKHCDFSGSRKAMILCKARSNPRSNRNNISIK